MQFQNGCNKVAMCDSRKYPYLYHGQCLGIPRARGILWTEILRTWRFSRVDRQECDIADYCNTADYCGKQDTRQALIDHACVHVHLQTENYKIWVVHLAPETLRLMNFLSENRLWQTLTRHVCLLCASDTYS